MPNPPDLMNPRPIDKGSAALCARQETPVGSKGAIS